MFRPTRRAMTEDLQSTPSPKDELAVVTGASGQIGRALLQVLRARGIPTLAAVRPDADSRLPADRVVQGLIDSEEVATAIKAGTILFALAGTLHPRSGNSYQQANVRGASAAAAAMRNSSVRRVLFLSHLGADEASDNEYLRSKGKAEQVLSHTGRQAVIFRCSHVIGVPEDPGPTASALIARGGRKVTVFGTGRQVVQPILRDDVVQALMAAAFAPATGRFDLCGPDRMTMDELVAVLNGNRAVRIERGLGLMKSLFAKVTASVPVALTEVMGMDCVGDPHDAVATFGLTLHAVRDAWTTGVGSNVAS